ncbi:unnamed protein product [Moneuplotes crassus]|uniref:Uncharacterized protein n=1 Tax=Euplotes crassus TaxID=5936 RepID=A0AAD1UPQ5_EUPCR|nr:unnamed protein product [Moneuplotes crassus]
MNQQRVEVNNISDFLGTKIQKKPTKISKEKMTFLDSTAVTAKMKMDSTLTTNAMHEGASLMKNNISSTLFPDMQKTNLMDSQMSKDSFNVTIPLEKGYEKINSKLLDTDEDEEMQKLEDGQLVVNPKKIEEWLSLAIKGAMKKGLLKESSSNVSYKTLSADEVNKATKKIDVLKKFGIDRDTLRNNGIDDDSITRIYRALYVYSLGFYELIKEPLERGNNRKLLLSTIWKIYSVLLQHVGKAEYATVVSNLTNAYQMDVINLEEQMRKQKEHYTKRKEEMMINIHKLTEELKETQEKLEASNERAENLVDENIKLQAAVEREKELRNHFEDKFCNIERLLNGKDTDLKIAKDDLHKMLDEVQELKESMEIKDETISILRNEKFKNDQLLQEKITECAGLKENILSKSAVITQRDKRVRELLKEVSELTKTMHDLEKEISTQNIKMSVVQSRVVDGKTETHELESKLEKIKRVNLNLEERVQVLTEKFEEVNQKYTEVDSKYIALVQVEKFLRQDNQDFHTKNHELEKTLDLLREKSSGLEVKLKNSIDKYELTKKDYEDTIKTLEEINRQRNKLEDQVMIKNKHVKDVTSELESLQKNLYNECNLSNRLQQRLNDLEAEFQTISRRETANAEMSEIQIASLESKYLGMYKKCKEEQKQKLEWMYTYQNSHQEHLENEVELKKALGSYKGQVLRNKDLRSDNEKYKNELKDWENKCERLNDEKIDLLTKIDRKNNEVDSLKMTYDNLENHNAEYIKKLRDLNKEMVKKMKRIESIKQMEVEDLTMKVINYEVKVMKSEEGLLEAENELFQFKCTMKQAESKLKHAEERADVLKAENLDVKSKLAIEQTQNTVNKEKLIKMESYKEKVELLTTLSEKYKENIEELKKENQEKEDKIMKTKDELTLMKAKRPSSFSIKKNMKSQRVQTINVMPTNLPNNLHFEQKSSKGSILSYNKSCKDLTEASKIKTARYSVAQRSISDKNLLPRLSHRDITLEEGKGLEKSLFLKHEEPSETQRDTTQSVINLPEASIITNFNGWKVEHTHGKKSRNFKGPIKPKESRTMRNIIKNAFMK